MASQDCFDYINQSYPIIVKICKQHQRNHKDHAKINGSLSTDINPYSTDLFQIPACFALSKF